MPTTTAAERDRRRSAVLEAVLSAGSATAAAVRPLLADEWADVNPRTLDRDLQAVRPRLEALAVPVAAAVGSLPSTPAIAALGIDPRLTPGLVTERLVGLLLTDPPPLPALRLAAEVLGLVGRTAGDQSLSVSVAIGTDITTPPFSEAGGGGRRRENTFGGNHTGFLSDDELVGIPQDVVDVESVFPGNDETEVL